jgi:sortase A
VKDRLRLRLEVFKRLELLLWTAGVLCFLVCLATGVCALAARMQAETFGRSPVWEFAGAGQVGATQDAGAVGRSVPVIQPDAAEKPGATRVIGRLEIPQIALSVPVMADYDPNSLLRGIGHIQGTAMPGGLGTMGLAGHRDTYFRALQRVALKMDIRVADETGTYHYQVDSTEVVTPEQVEVLEIRQRPELTLITCYPFYYVGAAPKRFIVHAHLLSAAPDLP